MQPTFVRSMPRQTRLALATVLLAWFAPAGAASVTGAFALGGKPFTPTQAAAFRVRDQFSPRQHETFVMLTLKPVDKDQIAQAIDAYSVAINDPATMHADWIGVTVQDEGTVSINANIAGTQYVDSSGSLMGMPGDLVASCTENSATRVACTVKTREAVKPHGGGPGWTLDLTFASDVLARKAGKPMAKDGEAPGKAFLALSTAIAKGDLTGIRAGMLPSTAKTLVSDEGSPEATLKAAHDILEARVPQQPRVTGGEWTDDSHALLEVEGAAFAGRRMLYLVGMQRVEGRWLFDDATPLGLLKKE